MNGSSIATKPSRTGSFVFAAAWTMADEPKPASLEKTPRAVPYWIAAPNMPPPTASGLKA